MRLDKGEISVILLLFSRSRCWRLMRLDKGEISVIRLSYKDSFWRLGR